MRLIDADKLDMSVKVDGDRTLSPISQLIAQTIIENAQTIESDEDCISRVDAIKAIRNYNVTIEVSRAIGKSQLADIVDSINKVQEKMISELPSVQPKTDVLDKIRAEIKEESKFCPFTEGLERALEIIDKYKAESEDKE